MSGSDLRASKVRGPSYFPPKKILDLSFSASSQANFISRPGWKGVKSVGNPNLVLKYWRRF